MHCVVIEKQGADRLSDFNQIDNVFIEGGWVDGGRGIKLQENF